MGVRPRSIALGNACFGVAECLKIGRKSLTNRDIIRLASLCIVKQRFRPAYRRITDLPVPLGQAWRPTLRACMME